MRSNYPTTAGVHPFWRVSIIALPMFWFGSFALLAQEPVNTEDEIDTLSPFEISSDSNQGYYATQTLSGGRINSNISDIGSSIQAVTEEFLQDVAATSDREVLLYTTNTDVAGPNGNSSGVVLARGEQSDETVRTNIAASNRIRGIAAANNTRNYFRTDLPFDSYNSGRLDILRGPNSFLFGLGSPGGVINYQLDRAVFDDVGTAGVRFTNEDFGSNLTQRYEANFNKEVIDDRLAARIAGVWEDREYIQDPANLRNERIYGAVTWRILKDQQIFFRSHIERGTLSGTPPSSLGPIDNISPYLENPSNINYGGPANRAQRDPYTFTLNDQGYQGLDADGNPLNVPRGVDDNNSLNRKWGLVFDDTVDANGHPTRAFQTGFQGSYWAPGNSVLDPDNSLAASHDVWYDGGPNLFDLGGAFAGWNKQGLVDYTLYDFRKTLITGSADSVKHGMENYNVSLEATGWDNRLGIELAYNKELYDRNSIIVAGAPVLKYDANRTLPIGPNSLFGNENPNYGRLFFTGFGARPRLEVERDTYRVTAFAKYDFTEKFGDSLLRWLGRHQATGLYDHDIREEENIQFRLYSFGNEAGYHLDQPDATQFQRQAPPIFYVSPSQPEAVTNPNFSLGDFDIQQLSGNFNLDFPDNYSVPVAYWDQGGAGLGDESTQVAGHTPRFAVGDARKDKTTVDSFAINLQSHLLNDNLVVNLGWRQDKWENYNVSAPPDSNRESIRNIDESVFNFDGVTPSEVDDDNFSYNFVLKVPQQWMPDGYGLSFHYGKSDNFIPSLVGTDIDGTPVPSSSGEGEDYGFTIRAFDNKLVARVNWYKTSINNEFFPPVDFGFKWTSAAHLARMYGNMQVETWNVDNDGDGRIDSGDDNGNGILDNLEGNGNTYLSLPELIDIRDRYDAIFTDYLREVGGYTFTPGDQRPNGRAAYGLGSGIFFALADTADVTGEGLEVELVYNPTPSWRIALNVVQQKASRSNLAPRFTQLMNDLIAAHDAVPNSKLAHISANKLGRPLGTDPLAGGTLWNRLILNPNSGGNYFPNVSLEGADNPEVREWRVNAITNYVFREGRLKGANIGAGYRYVDNAAVGYGLKTENGILQQDPFQPYFDDAEHIFDTWAGYQFDVTDSIQWRIQLNIRNLFASDDVRVIMRQPDGSAGRVRYSPPRTFILQNTFAF
jgi:outer membrane receptor protein involved in Fe transport